MAKGVSLGSINRSTTQFPGRNSIGKKWVLASGAEATFVERDISYEILESKTFVDFEVNGRWQELLTDAVLSRLSSLDKQQFMPVIGIEHDNGQIEILDGSNRRAYILSKNGEIGSLRALITKSKISKDDAKALAKEIRSGLEQCLYEIGMLAKPYEKQGKSQREIAKLLGFSQSKINKGLKTRSIPEEIIKLFPSAYDLTWPDYQSLIEISKQLKLPLSKDQRQELDKLASVDKIIKALSNYAEHKNTSKPLKKSPSKTISSLLEFEKGSRKKAEKQVSPDGKTTTYRFVRVGAEADAIIEQKLQEAILEIARRQSQEKNQKG
ncbi:hypothetical protein M5236_004725 [Vibrio parahaemolyticus]|nr:hypothetical protein [Vibrio parahaemolyticus]